jgi:hypothetical protein
MSASEPRVIGRRHWPQTWQRAEFLRCLAAKDLVLLVILLNQRFEDLEKQIKDLKSELRLHELYHD